jgi:hypothetical protein
VIAPEPDCPLAPWQSAQKAFVAEPRWRPRVFSKITVAQEARNLRNLREKTRVFRAIFGKIRQKVSFAEPGMTQVEINRALLEHVSAGFQIVSE